MRIKKKKKNIVKDGNIKEEPKDIKSPNWIDKNKFYYYLLLLLTATNLITRTKLANLSMLTLKKY